MGWRMAMEKTRVKVERLRLGNPLLPAVDIARQVGVSRERVRQLLVRLGLPTRIKPEPVQWCRVCEKPIRKVQSFCSMECWSTFHRIKVICYGCGITFSLRKSVYRARSRRNVSARFWHSRACWSINHGKNFRPYRLSPPRLVVENLFLVHGFFFG